jgi:uncharacterized protein involved in type VI secretion and phage assembly
LGISPLSLSSKSSDHAGFLITVRKKSNFTLQKAMIFGQKMTIIIIIIIIIKHHNSKHYTLLTAGNRHKQNSWFCKEIREDDFRFWWRRVHEDASQGMYMSKIEIDLSRLQFTSDESEFIPDYI